MKPLTHPHWTMEDVSAVPPRRKDVCEHELDGEAVLFDPKARNTYLLNGTALAVWRRCDGRATTQQIADEQSTAYEVQLEAARDHVEQLVALFADSGLLDLAGD